MTRWCTPTALLPRRPARPLRQTPGRSMRLRLRASLRQWARPRCYSSRFLAALLGNLPDLVRLRLLRLVRVVGTGVDLELAERLAAERVLRQHPLDGLLDGSLRVLGHQVRVADRAQAARVAG